METTQNTSNATKGNEMEQEYMTGYQIHKAVSIVLERESLASIPAQMVYNYIKNNLIPSQAMKDGKRLVKREDAMKWIEKYVNNKKIRQNLQK